MPEDTVADAVAVAAKVRADEKPAKSLPGQVPVRVFYNSVTIQVAVAVLIGANFLTNMIEKQIDPVGNRHNQVFKALDLFYNIAFTLELWVNMYAHWMKPFFRSGWNVFDLVVVTIGVVNTLELPLPKAFSLLRMMRAFRVFRLFKRVKSLNKIITSIVHAIPGVLNAFLILAIVMAIYSILAVEFFKEVGEGTDCHLSRANRTLREGFGTKRLDCMGHEYFGTFSKSIYTFFQVLTGESWSENVARPIIWYYEDKFRSFCSSLFFVSFILVTVFVLTNVVVAVLLDKMTEVDDDAEVAPEAPLQDDEVEILPTVLSKEEKMVAKKLGKMHDTLGELAASNADLTSDFDRTKTDMAEMRVQVAALAKAIEMKYRIAHL